MAKKEEIGVITEQGFVAGNGLGFKPIQEKELKPNKKTETPKIEKENKKN